MDNFHISLLHIYIFLLYKSILFFDFGKQIVDSMLDDNFANTGDKDFIPLFYITLVVTANTPPNMYQLTENRSKLLTFFPIYNGKVIKDP